MVPFICELIQEWKLDVSSSLIIAEWSHSRTLLVKQFESVWSSKAKNVFRLRELLIFIATTMENTNFSSSNERPAMDLTVSWSQLTMPRWQRYVNKRISINDPQHSSSPKITLPSKCFIDKPPIDCRWIIELINILNNFLVILSVEQSEEIVKVKPVDGSRPTWKVNKIFGNGRKQFNLIKRSNNYVDVKIHTS